MKRGSVCISAVVLLGGFLFLSMLLYFARGEWERIASSMRELPLPIWVAVLLLSLLNYGFRFLRWHFALQDLTKISIPLGDHLCCYVSGFAFTATPGKAGELSRAVFLKERGIPYNATFSVFIFEKILDLLTIVMIACLVSLSFPRFGMLAWVGFLLGIAALLLLRWLPQIVIGIPSSRLRKKLVPLMGFATRAQVIFRARALLAGMSIGTVAWTFEAVGLYLVLNALDVSVPLYLAAGIYGLAMLAGALSFVPGGIGGAEAVMVFCVTASGAPLPIAIAATIVCRISTLWFAIGLGVLALPILAIRRRRVGAVAQLPATAGS